MSEAVSNLLKVLSDPFFGTLSPMVIAARAELASLQSENQRLQGEVDGLWRDVSMLREALLEHDYRELSTAWINRECSDRQKRTRAALIATDALASPAPSEQREEKI